MPFLLGTFLIMLVEACTASQQPRPHLQPSLLRRETADSADQPGAYKVAHDKISLDSHGHVQTMPNFLEGVSTETEIAGGALREVQKVVSSLLDMDELIPISEICVQLELDGLACSRVKTYLGARLLNVTSPLYLKHRVQDAAFNPVLGGVTTRNGLQQLQVPSGYPHILSTKEYAGLFEYIPSDATKDKPFIMLQNWGRCHLAKLSYPTLVKAAPVPDPTGNFVLARIYRKNYELPMREALAGDIKFHQKSDSLVWRGSARIDCHATTPWPNRSRMLFVQKYHNSSDSRIDVGVAPEEPGVPEDWLRPMLSIPDLLKHKFIMLLEGIDVATSMEWVMASNSVPFMLSCTVQTWGLHSWLEPWKHYVPIADDFSDLSEKLDWAISHPYLAENIATEGRKFYMYEFYDEGREDRINAAVLVAYFNRFRIEDSADDAELIEDPLGGWCDRNATWH